MQHHQGAHADAAIRIDEDSGRFSVARANWKLLAENSTDNLHVVTLHPTYLDMVKTNSAGTMVRGKVMGASVDLGNGHAVVERQASYGRPIAQWIPMWGEEAKVEKSRQTEFGFGRTGERASSCTRNVQAVRGHRHRARAVQGRCAGVDGRDRG
jgi:p-cumate 2,3-dioxygenase alpha subunit